MSDAPRIYLSPPYMCGRELDFVQELLVQAQALLDAGHPSTLVVPLTTTLLDDAEPLRVRVPASQRLRRPSDLLVDQLRAIDNRRLIKGPLTRLPRPLMARVDEAVREVLGLPGA